MLIAYYPTRSLLRYGLDIFCSISQNIQTKAAPRQITITRNSNVNAGAVSMFNTFIRCKRRTSEGNQNHGLGNEAEVALLSRLSKCSTLSGVGSSQIPAQV
jgi:hypothetical protein